MSLYVYYMPKFLDAAIVSTDAPWFSRCIRDFLGSERKSFWL